MLKKVIGFLHHHHTHIKKIVLITVVGEAVLGIVLAVHFKQMDMGMLHLACATLIKDIV